MLPAPARLPAREVSAPPQSIVTSWCWNRSFLGVHERPRSRHRCCSAFRGTAGRGSHGGASHLVGGITGVTMLCNVPRNELLADIVPTEPESERIWGRLRERVDALDTTVRAWPRRSRPGRRPSRRSRRTAETRQKPLPSDPAKRADSVAIRSPQSPARRECGRRPAGGPTAGHLKARSRLVTGGSAVSVPRSPSGSPRTVRVGRADPRRVVEAAAHDVARRIEAAGGRASRSTPDAADVDQVRGPDRADRAGARTSRRAGEQRRHADRSRSMS